MRVLLFARARELAGADAVAIALDPGATVAELKQALAKSHPRLQTLLARCTIAVNNEYADEATPLPANAEIAVIPPVSGGAAGSPLSPLGRGTGGEGRSHKR